MQPHDQVTKNIKPESGPAVQHLSGARELLIELQAKIGDHPELAEAITKVETALSILTVQTAGLL